MENKTSILSVIEIIVLLLFLVILIVNYTIGGIMILSAIFGTGVWVSAAIFAAVNVTLSLFIIKCEQIAADQAYERNENKE